uniref:Uncharacterized protein n=1 Tax=Rhizophora mucronata TaxID=61149 RepID=A0A2P2IYI8_RHIMU
MELHHKITAPTCQKQFWINISVQESIFFHGFRQSERVTRI